MSDVFSVPNTGRVLRQMSVAPTQERVLGLSFLLARLRGGALDPVVMRLARFDLMHVARRVEAEMIWLETLSEAQLRETLAQSTRHLHRDRTRSAATRHCLAAICAMCQRTTGMRPFRTQIAGALGLYAGHLIEVETGSGKTLTAALAAALAAQAGDTVHVITSNAYLAARDRAEFAPLYEALGLTTGLIANSVPPAERPAQYRARIVYACNKDIAFDYLRDRIALGASASPLRLSLEAVHDPAARAGRLKMRGLPFAIIDEVDAVCIDECRTPLILSQTAEPDPDWAADAMGLADGLERGRDYDLDAERRMIELTSRGQARLSELGEEMGGIWRNALRREQAAIRALSARELFHRGEHYVVENGQIQLVDEFTGRLTPDRSLGDGIHQLVEAKEGVAITGRRVTLGRMTYQRFFRRYARMAGMTGTAREVRGEFAAVYGLKVLRLPPPKRSRRKYGRTRIFGSEARKRDWIAQRTQTLSAAGRPVLIATRTIASSEALADILRERGLQFELLNALQDADEADVIAAAGAEGRITVATNMAGRGVDIKIAPKAAQAGGLHVILTEFHEAGRIDRQALGRCARQGDPGSCETVLSWADPLVQKFGGWRARLRYGGVRVFERAQRRAERLHAGARRDLLRQDLKRDEFLDFTGGGE